jgi:hypothetical protein
VLHFSPLSTEIAERSSRKSLARLHFGYVLDRALASKGSSLHTLCTSESESLEVCGPTPRPCDQTAYALNLTSRFAKSTVPGAQTWIGFTQEYSAAEVVSVMFNRS